LLRARAAAQGEHPMRLRAYGVLPNPWPVLLWPERARTLTPFVSGLTLTPTQRWHASRGTAGSGPLSQGRLQSFGVAADEHLLTVGRYGERNALGAALVGCAEH
jgi:putative transposase